MNASICFPHVFPVACHTDFVGEDSIFVAIEGYADNGVHYIRKAIERGARTIVVHHDAFLDAELCLFMQQHHVCLERVDNTRKALAILSAQRAGFPAQKLKIIGITGTKGKTTTSFLLAHMLATAGYKTALISSVQNRIADTVFAASLTTPQPDYLQQFLKLCVEHTIDYVVMEVAAQALTLYRVHGIRFCGTLFTNFSHEHLEFYRDLEDYFQAKCLLFEQVSEGSPILINHDNNYCAQLCHKRPDFIKYGFCGDHHDYHGVLTTDTMCQIGLHIRDHNNAYAFTCPTLFGTYNAYNVLAAASMALALNIQPNAIDRALQTFTGVPGRLQEHALRNGARCFIDYAHNPESFHAVLSTLRLLTSRLIVVFGAGGGKDKLKRPIMGRIAAEIADIIIVTSDNPRLEDPVVITGDIVCGIPEQLQNKIIQELDRKKAIECAYQVSDESSIIALLGKGPDEYQIIGTTKHYFSERTIVEQL